MNDLTQEELDLIKTRRLQVASEKEDEKQLTNLLETIFDRATCRFCSGRGHTSKQCPTLAAAEDLLSNFPKLGTAWTKRKRFIAKHCLEDEEKKNKKQLSSNDYDDYFGGKKRKRDNQKS
jgi:hypothetical protein